jgi:hypothetical protein
MSELLGKDAENHKNEPSSSAIGATVADSTSSGDNKHHDSSPDNLIKIAGEIMKPMAKLSTLDNEAKLDMIRTLTRTLADNRVEPKFSLPWLLGYMAELQHSNADEPTKAAFNKWAWEAFSDEDSGNNNNNDAHNKHHGHKKQQHHEKLGHVPASVMIQFVNDIAKQKHSDADVQKVRQAENKPGLLYSGGHLTVFNVKLTLKNVKSLKKR